MPQLLKRGLPSQVKTFLVCALMLPFLAACITSVNPLSTDKYQDDALIGMWHSDENPKNMIDLVIKKGDGGNLSVVQTESNEGKPRSSSYTCFVTKGARTNYINMMMESANQPVKYMIFEYYLKQNQMHLRALSFDVLKQEMQAGRLSGNFNETTWGTNMQIAEPGAKLLALLDGPNGEKFFGEELVFTRLEEHVQSEVEGMLREQVDAWNNGDLDRFMNTYLKSDTLTFASVDGELRGWDTVRARYQKKYGTNKESMGHLAFSDLEITPLGHTHALAIGHWHITNPGKPDLNGIFSLVLIKSDGAWKILHDHTSRFVTATP
jgi:ketosteroid isomerase-like protein